MDYHKKHNASSDLLLWKELCKGNEDAFQRVYDKYVQELFDYGMRFSQDEDLVKDSIQEMFVYIYKKRNSLGKTDNIKYYLLKTLKRRIFRILRKNNKIVHLDISEMPFSIIGSAEDEIMSDEQTNELKANLKNAIEKLPPRQKEALFLRFNEGLEYTEICKIMEVDYQSVRNIVSRAISKLRGLMPEILIVDFYFLQHFFRCF